MLKWHTLLFALHAALSKPKCLRAARFIFGLRCNRSTSSHRFISAVRTHYKCRHDPHYFHTVLRRVHSRSSCLYAQPHTCENAHNSTSIAKLTSSSTGKSTKNAAHASASASALNDRADVFVDATQSWKTAKSSTE